MNKNIIIAVVVLVLALGGYYVFSSSQVETTDSLSDTTIGLEEHDGDAMMEADGDAMMEADGDAMMEADGDAMMEADGDAMMEEVREVIIEGKNFEFSEDKLTFKKGERVKLTFKSTSGFHDFVVDELDIATKQVNTGGEDTIEFTVPDTAGEYAFYCSVGNHRAQGMEGVLTVE